MQVPFSASSIILTALRWFKMSSPNVAIPRILGYEEYFVNKIEDGCLAGVCTQ